jgi:hypothetical protein
MLTYRPTIIMGGDSTRSPGNAAIAAVTGTVDHTFARFIARARINGSKDEVQFDCENFGENFCEN